MAQQGGTWSHAAKKSGFQPNEKAIGDDVGAVTSSSASQSNRKSAEDATPAASGSAPCAGKKGQKADSQEWAVVAHPDDESQDHGKGISSHFDFQVGWGKWKWSLLKWNVSVGQQPAPSSTENSGKKNSGKS